MSMAANRHKGIRAALCTNPYTAKLSREHNNANVLCMGGRILGPNIAFEIVNTFLNTPFEGGRHIARVKNIELK
jgi:ribose 5-phosphate isomerase B